MDDFAFHQQGKGWFRPRGRADDEWTGGGGLKVRLDDIGKHSEDEDCRVFIAFSLIVGANPVPQQYSSHGSYDL